MQYSLLFRGVAGLASAGALSSWLGLVPGMESFSGYNPLAAGDRVAEVAADTEAGTESNSYVTRYQASGSLSDGLPTDGLPALPNSFPQDDGGAVGGSPAAPPSFGGLSLPQLDRSDVPSQGNAAPGGSTLPPSPVLPQTPTNSPSSFSDRYTSGGGPDTSRPPAPVNELRSNPAARPMPGSNVSASSGGLGARNGNAAILPPGAAGLPTRGTADLNSRVMPNPNEQALPPRNPNSFGGQPGSLNGQSNYEAAQAQLRREQGAGVQNAGTFPNDRQQPGTQASPVAYDSNGRLRNFEQPGSQQRAPSAGNRFDPSTIARGLPYVTPPPARRGNYATSPYDHGLFMNAAYQRRAVAVDPNEKSAVTTRGPGQLASTQVPLTGRENLPQYQQVPGIYPTAYQQCNPVGGVALGAPTLPPPGNVPGQAVPPTLPPNLAPGMYSANNNGYSPLLSLGQEGYNVQIGRGIVGQPTVYVPGQPVRNFLRYLSP